MKIQVIILSLLLMLGCSDVGKSVKVNPKSIPSGAIVIKMSGNTVVDFLKLGDTPEKVILYNGAEPTIKKSQGNSDEYIYKYDTYQFIDKKLIKIEKTVGNK